MQSKTKENEIYLFPVEENPMINCYEAANSADSEVLWGRKGQRFRDLKIFKSSSFSEYRKFDLEEQ